MPSPFPGMDPFLEAPLSFEDFHQSLAYTMRAQLTACLPKPYYAALVDRTYIGTARQVETDVSVLREELPTPRDRRGALAVLEVAEPITIPLTQIETRETYIDVYTRRGEEERLVTSIEVLSPANKSPGEKGRELYRRKQEETLASQTHLIEIDLLRGGTHTTAVPLADLRARAGRCDYHVCLKHFDNPDELFVYP
ncbi:MAG: DUF4058 family protein, partial [Gemmataceae bacterium]|nr:DUF4058 family protein [Gemmataceae bacterium]